MPFCESIKSRNFFLALCFSLIGFLFLVSCVRLQLNFNFQKISIRRRVLAMARNFPPIHKKKFSYLALAKIPFFNLTFSSFSSRRGIYTHRAAFFHTERAKNPRKTEIFLLFRNALPIRASLILFWLILRVRKSAPAIKNGVEND